MVAKFKLLLCFLEPFEAVRTIVSRKSKLHRTVRSRHYLPGSAGSTSFKIPNKRTLTVWGTPWLYLSGFSTKIHTAHQSPRHPRTTGHQHIQRFNSDTIQQAMWVITVLPNTAFNSHYGQIWYNFKVKSITQMLWCKYFTFAPPLHFVLINCNLSELLQG